MEVNGWPRYKGLRNIAKSFNLLSRVHERYRRQTGDRRQTTDRQTDLRWQRPEGNVVTFGFVVILSLSVLILVLLGYLLVSLPQRSMCALLFHLLICVSLCFYHCIHVLTYLYYVLIYSASELQECLINLLTYLVIYPILAILTSASIVVFVLTVTSKVHSVPSPPPSFLLTYSNLLNSELKRLQIFNTLLYVLLSKLLNSNTSPLLSAPCGPRGCKNRAHSVSWPEVVKDVPNQGLDCFVS